MNRRMNGSIIRLVVSLLLLAIMSRAAHANVERKTIELCDGIPVEFVWCSAGTFLMGAAATDASSSESEKPAHRIGLSNGFWISRHLVSQKLWSAVMSSASETGTAAKTGISFEDAMIFVNRLCGKTGITFRIPTEAELEYAYRAGTSTIYFWGDYYDAISEAGDNPWGITDWNLVQYSSDVFNRHFYGHSPSFDPQCKHSETPGALVSVRGGAKHRASERSAVTPFDESEKTGLRIVSFSLNGEKINPIDLKTGNDENRLDVSESPFYRNVIWVVDVHKGSEAERQGVRRGDILCRLGRWEFGGGYDAFKDQIRKTKEEGKKLIVFRGSSAKPEIRSFTFPSGGMGIRFQDGSMPTYRAKTVEETYFGESLRIKTERRQLSATPHSANAYSKSATVGANDFVAAIRSGRFDMSASGGCARSSMLVAAGMDHVSAVCASLQQSNLAIQSKNADAVDFHNKLRDTDSEGRRELYRRLRESVESKARAGNNVGAMNEFHASLLGLDKYKEDIGGDCAEWIQNTVSIWTAAMKMDSNSVDARIKSSKPHEFQCFRCGMKYYGQLSCPQCSAPRYSGTTSTSPITVRDEDGKLYHIDDIYKRQ